MPQLSMTVYWRFEVTGDEMVLLLRGLSGRLRTEDTEAAKELSTRLTEIRMQKLLDASRAHEAAANRLGAILDGPASD